MNLANRCLRWALGLKGAATLFSLHFLAVLANLGEVLTGGRFMMLVWLCALAAYLGALGDSRWQATKDEQQLTAEKTQCG